MWNDQLLGIWCRGENEQESGMLDKSRMSTNRLGEFLEMRHTGAEDHREDKSPKMEGISISNIGCQSKTKTKKKQLRYPTFAYLTCSSKQRIGNSLEVGKVYEDTALEKFKTQTRTHYDVTFLCNQLSKTKSGVAS